MIHIYYHRSMHRVTVQGHALSGEVGRDLVCAAVSTLTYTLVEFVRSIEAEKTDIRLYKGRAYVSASVSENKKERLTNGFDDICRGFRILAENFPKNVSFCEV